MQSEQINELAAALSIAQGQITGALKDSANPYFKSKYADLASCWDACRKQLSENGLAVIQTTDIQQIVCPDGSVEQIPVVVTTLAHKSGQWIRGIMPIKAKDDGPQAQGSGVTYARRYALAAIVGLAQIDDDAEAAQARDKKISPMPDPVALSAKDEATVKSFVNGFVDLLNADMEEDEKADKISAMRDEANERQDILIEVWRRLDSKTRAALKKYIEQANKRRAA